jgi:hypothetical protein
MNRLNKRVETLERKIFVVPRKTVIRLWDGPMFGHDRDETDGPENGVLPPETEKADQ